MLYYCVIRVIDGVVLYSGHTKDRALQAITSWKMVNGEGANLSEAVIAAKTLRDAALAKV